MAERIHSLDFIHRRLNVILYHVNPVHENDSSILTRSTCASTFDLTKKISDILHSDFPIEERDKFLEVYKNNPIFRIKLLNIPNEEHRRITTEKVKYLHKTGLLDISLIRTQPYELLNRLELNAIYSGAGGSTGVKFGVQSVLFGGSILNLGTEKHHKKYLEKVQRMELPGCFAMTELLHGSNVKDLQTTAIYDPESEEFIINTPNDGAMKFWIGNAYRDGKIATVFARLITNGVDYGVHPFLVPLRDDAHKLLFGVEIGYCGDKIGLNGVDNGWIKFNNVRIPRENLLNRFGDVDKDGNYSSPFTSENRRFAAILGELITGRVLIVGSSLGARKIGCTIVIRYANARKQFGPPDNDEIPIIDYKSYQIRIMPILASCYAFHFAKRHLYKKFADFHLSKVRNEDDVAELHALAAGLKAIVTWDTQQYINTFRELCGGHGYSSYNFFGVMRNDHDISQTFEGDNTVLLQQTAFYLLDEFKDQFRGNRFKQILTFVRMKTSSMMDRNPLTTRLSTFEHLRSQEFQLQAFKYRTANLLEKVAFKFKSASKKKNKFEAWNSCLPLVVPLGRAYVEQFTLEKFIDEVNAQKDPKIKEILKLLCDLFALSIISRDLGDFLDVIKANKAKAIRSLIIRLCAKVRKYSLNLVNAFEIPDWFLDAPIGNRDGQYEEATLKILKEIENDNLF